MLRRLFILYFGVLFVADLLLRSALGLRKTGNRSCNSIIGEKGFTAEVFFLKNLTSFRSNDNWLNASVEKENAYAATNYPFEIMTIYADFYEIPVDDTERAAILLHEARHLFGADEKDAYTYVWKNRFKLGWTKENYLKSVVWINVRKQTKEVNPEIFQCPEKLYGDCTEY